MKAGQRIRVFEDPITERHCEGVATLKKQERGVAADGRENWWVRFADDVNGDDGFNVCRSVHPRNVIADAPSVLPPAGAGAEAPRVPRDPSH